MKKAYVASVRRMRTGLQRTGGLKRLDDHARRSRPDRWLRSLLAIHDLEDLVCLDLPWWPMRAERQIDEFLAGRPEPRVFEWGSGASTVWLSRRAHTVRSVEHDRQWADRVRPLLASNVTLSVIEPSRIGQSNFTSSKRGFEGLDFGEYVAAIDESPEQYDLIVVDGRSREACLPRALRHLAPAGLILLDNVERRRYRQAVRGLTGVRVTWTVGATPCLPYPTASALIGTFVA